MRYILTIIILLFASTAIAQSIGRAEPPFVEATVTYTIKSLMNPDKRYDLCDDLAEKSDMNRRLVIMKVTEAWTKCSRQKDFMKDLKQSKNVSFTIKVNGEVLIKPDGKLRKDSSNRR